MCLFWWCSWKQTKGKEDECKRKIKKQQKCKTWTDVVKYSAKHSGVDWFLSCFFRHAEAWQCKTQNSSWNFNAWNFQHLSHTNLLGLSVIANWQTNLSVLFLSSMLLSISSPCSIYHKHTALSPSIRPPNLLVQPLASSTKPPFLPLSCLSSPPCNPFLTSFNSSQPLSSLSGAISSAWLVIYPVETPLTSHCSREGGRNTF